MRKKVECDAQKGIQRERKETRPFRRCRRGRFRRECPQKQLQTATPDEGTNGIPAYPMVVRLFDESCRGAHVAIEDCLRERWQ